MGDGEPVTADLAAAYAAVRGETEALCEPLAVDDYCVQPMPDASPPKWHLAHTAWFFETFLLKPYGERYAPFANGYEHLFNSYYNGVGDPYPRLKRGALSRPTVAEVFAYRAHVDRAMQGLLTRDDADVRERVVLGLNHEQQHQELIITDVKFNLGVNPLRPAYRADLDARPCAATPLRYAAFAGGLLEIGAGRDGFSFDNETPRHKVWLRPFELAERPATNGEYLEFIEDGGYRQPALWLSEGWAAAQRNGWQAPLYWRREGGDWSEYRLSGPAALDLNAPVTHLSFFEAEAFARWAGGRLPTEAEWENAAANSMTVAGGHFSDGGRLHPRGAANGGMAQLFGDVWEWTASAYGPYPGYRPLPGALGEYNGKFMANQMVLRGGSCATPAGHVRASYRNFFYGQDRWQFSGVRLARDVA